MGAKTDRRKRWLGAWALDADRRPKLMIKEDSSGHHWMPISQLRPVGDRHVDITDARQDVEERFNCPQFARGWSERIYASL
jgi:hypothetical protein